MASITSYTARMTFSEEVPEATPYVDPSGVSVKGGTATDKAADKVTPGTLPGWSYDELNMANTASASSDLWVN